MRCTRPKGFHTLPRYAAGAGLALALLVLLSPTLARAGCSDPPAPGVNWQRCIMDGEDFSAVDLEDARLRDASFIRSDLTGSNFRAIDGFRAKFINAVLHDADFDGAELYQADFTKADLSGASLVGADLRLARFYRAILIGADLTGADLEGADLTRTDFSGATWTDGIRICAQDSIGRCL